MSRSTSSENVRRIETLGLNEIPLYNAQVILILYEMNFRTRLLLIGVILALFAGWMGLRNANRTIEGAGEPASAAAPAAEGASP